MRCVGPLLTASFAVLAACGGGSPSSPSTDTAEGRTVTITSAGVNPSQLSVAPGTRVVFANSDTRPHNVTSDPHPDHTDCPDVNAVGLLQPGQRRETGNLVAVRTCGFHDHDDPPPAGSRWAGRITVR